MMNVAHALICKVYYDLSASYVIGHVKTIDETDNIRSVAEMKMGGSSLGED